MESRTKKYYANKKSKDGSKKGSANEGGYNEQNETTIIKPNEHPAASEDDEMMQSIKDGSDQGKTPNNSVEQDDTVGEKN